MRIRKRAISVALLLFVTATGGYLLSSSSKVRWRAQLFTWKLTGSLPFWSWREVLERMGPSWTSAAQITGLEAFRRGLIQFKERGENPCPVSWETPLGAFWGRSNDGATLAKLMEEQLLDHVYEHGPVRVQPEDIVFDVGAHLGTFTRYALSRAAGLVVAFEPEPTNITCFQRTFQKEITEGRVLLVEAALWESSGILELQTRTNSGTATVVPELFGWSPGLVKTRVKAATLDETVEDLKLPRVDFIKMDIEGAERRALLGARQTLSRFGPRMALCIYHRPDDRQVIPTVVLGIRSSYRVLTKEDQAYFY